jgi:hypothetical protein
MNTTAEASVLQNIVIAAPCSAEWNNMPGDEKVRVCAQCSKNVHNLSSMTEAEAASLLEEAGAVMPCLRFFRRQDGTIMFENCPVGLRKVRDAVKYSLRVMSVILSWLISFTSAWAKQDDSEQHPSHINFVWTLSENGPLKRLIHWPETPIKPLAQLGGPGRIIIDPVQTRYLPANWSGSDSFQQALEYVERENYSMAEIEFRKALDAALRPGADPMYREFIAIEYGKLLRKIGKPEAAVIIETKNKFTASDCAIEE